MEIIFAIPLLLLPLLMPLISGLMAENFGRKFWPWFILGIPLPLVANIILLCLPDRSKTRKPESKPVENDRIYDHLFLHDDVKTGWQKSSYSERA